MRFLLIVLMFSLPADVNAWSTPQRGTADRAEMMDAIRPKAEQKLGAPLLFVIKSLRVSGDVGYADLHAVRPDGSEVDMYRTPLYRSGEIDPENEDGSSIQVLYQHNGWTWVAVHWSLGATEAWFSAPQYCAVWYSVIAEVC